MVTDKKCVNFAIVLGAISLVLIIGGIIKL